MIRFVLLRAACRSLLFCSLIACLAGCLDPLKRASIVATARPINENLLACVSPYPGVSANCPELYKKVLGPPTTPATNLSQQYLGALVYDSMMSCSEFMDGLVKNQGDANFAGDTATTIFSAVATVFKPLSTVHALTAAATISSGTKAAYLSGFYAKSSVQNFSTALSSSYYKPMSDYIEGLEKANNPIINIEVTKIQAIHASCSLASLEATVLATLKTASSTGTVTPDIPVSVDFDKPLVKANESSKLTITLSNGTGASATLSSDFVVNLTGTSVPTPAQVGGTCPGGKSATPNSLVYAKDGVVPEGGCTISALITPSTISAITAKVEAKALVTDQGSNSAAASATLNENAAAFSQPSQGQQQKQIQTPKMVRPGNSIQAYSKEH